MKTNLLNKLTSRKFWVTLVAFVTLLLVGFGMTESAAAEVAAIIMAGADVLIYVFSEGKIDEASAANQKE